MSFLALLSPSSIFREMSLALVCSGLKTLGKKSVKEFTVGKHALCLLNMDNIGDTWRALKKIVNIWVVIGILNLERMTIG